MSKPAAIQPTFADFKIIRQPAEEEEMTPLAKAASGLQ